MMTSLMTRSKSAAPEQLDRLGAAGAGDRLVIQVLERADGRGAHPRIVLDEQDLGAGDVDVALARLGRGVGAGLRPSASVRGR